MILRCIYSAQRLPGEAISGAASTELLDSICFRFRLRVLVSVRVGECSTELLDCICFRFRLRVLVNDRLNECRVAMFRENPSPSARKHLPESSVDVSMTCVLRAGNRTKAKLR